MALADFKLEDRFDRAEGDVAMSGVQALLRVLLDQLRADRRDGVHTAAMVSGYRGSPLGGIDALMLGNAEELKQNHITFLPGLNEDLGATAVWGSQLANRNFEGRYDGVLGMWYGKAPGVDRSGDAIKHANVCGVDPKGGVLLVAGDDPASKSSTLASESEPVLIHFQTPILYPGSVQEVIDYGRWGYELSRYSGFWSALKIVTNVADGYSTVEVGPGRVSAVRPALEWDGKPWAHTQQDALFGPNAVRMELEIHEGRMVAVDKFVAENKLNRQTVVSRDAKVGLIAAGKTYYDLREALDRMGLSEAELSRRGVRIFKPTVVWPLEPTSLREFARGLNVIVVVEEKRSVIETLVREILYGTASAPRVLGKRDAADGFWFPGHGEMDADLIARKIRPFLVDRFGSDGIGSAVPERITIPLAVTTSDGAKAAGRTPGFCSGCPHNRSTWVPEGSEAGGGIGCHGMAAMTPTRNVRGTTQMGGEGVQWVGAAPFVTMDHRFQNIGDGTFHHSGSLAVRQAIAAGTNVTYKILYNAAVAMTGGQDVDGGMEVPELTRSLHAEGAAKVMVVADDPDKYPAEAQFAPDTDVWHRDRLDEAQRLLRDIEGCTVLIYDQACAAELRRDRKRGKVAEPKTRVFINEAVCEGCGDCGEKSSCLSVQPVETEFGRKTQIHQSSCNKDFTCLDGDCPAFIEVVPGGKVPTKATAAVDEIGHDLPEPDRLDEGNMLMMGIGGTGVVTVNQMLATAALLDGKQANGLDQTGLAQKGGPVVSNLKIRRLGSTPDANGSHGSDGGEANKVGTGEADAYIVFDLLSGTNPVNLEKAQAGRTVALVSSSKVPTSAMVRDTSAEFPEWTAFQRSIDEATTPERNIYFDAGTLSDNLFRSHMPANVLVLGAAYQSGVVPISAAAIERAIELNGVAVEMNTQAFRIGRNIVLDPDFMETLHVERVGRVKRETGRSKREQKLVDAVPDQSEELARLLRIRVPDLVAYQSVDYAAAYAEFVAKVRDAEAAAGDETALSEAVARYLYKLMAYKDEYEVARLHRSEAFQQAVRDQFGDKTEITYKLHPPIMRRMGVDKKIGLGRSGDVAFALLARMKGLRGGALDIFGKTVHRRMERELIDEYRGMISRALDTLASGDDAAYARAVEIAELPDMIRGYEDIKEANVESFRARAAELGA
ncbi:indolepyruvate ferredoxin oxidoreductase family protein [Candidatus Poriferisodalis sp.]|uniref:indolepyruvate ferredoxin oxidoreductase family protein n=1 Tax=Candidatus Poriferisodalis sp. TaxID=3101277 RepID=UPI003B5BA384